MTDKAPFALYVRATNQVAFNVSDALGFSVEMSALAVSLFEEGPDTMQVQALYSTQKASRASFAIIITEQFYRNHDRTTTGHRLG